MDIVLYCLAIVIAAVITGLLGYFMVPFLHKDQIWPDYSRGRPQLA